MGERGLSTFKSNPSMPTQAAPFGSAVGNANPFLRNSSLFTGMNLSVSGPQSWTPASPKDMKTASPVEDAKA